MKKSLIIISLIAIILSATITSVFAASALINLEGATEVAPSTTSTVQVNISSDKEIGIVSGKIEHSSNITEIKLTGKNNWTVLAYNEEEGIFYILKAEGAKAEEIMEIGYTTGSEQGTGTITISDIELVTIDEETITPDNITKEIAIKNSTNNDNNEEDSKDDTTNGEEDSKDDTTNEDKNNNDTAEEGKDDTTDGDENNNDSKEDSENDAASGSTNNSDNKNTSKNQNTTISGKTTLPKAGMTKIILPIGIICAGGIVVVAYLAYRKYRGIK